MYMLYPSGVVRRRFSPPFGLELPFPTVFWSFPRAANVGVCGGLGRPAGFLPSGSEFAPWSRRSRAPTWLDAQRRLRGGIAKHGIVLFGTSRATLFLLYKFRTPFPFVLLNAYRFKTCFRFFRSKTFSKNERIYINLIFALYIQHFFKEVDLYLNLKS